MNNFNPDYLCNDVNCKSHEVIRYMIKEYQKAYKQLEAENKQLKEHISILKDVVEINKGIILRSDV